MAEEKEKPTNSNEQDDTQDTEASKSKNNKFSKLMSWFTPLENFTRENVRDLPLIRILDDKLGITTKRVLLVLASILFIAIIIVLFMIAFKPKHDNDSEAIASQTQSDASQGNKNEASDVNSPINNNNANSSINDISIPDVKVTTKPPIIDDKNLETIIKKADLMYKTGNKEEALRLFNHVASYSKAIANYNLGVINARSHEYEKSIQYYDSAIQAGEDIPLSAINAAVSAFHIGDMNRYQYYINIANTYANQVSNLPPYAYSYALNQYYQGQYFEALSPLNNDDKNFIKDTKRLAAKLYTVFNDNVNAYNNLKEIGEKQDELALGLLLARQGKLSEARGHIFSYLSQYPDDWNGRMALQIISLKLGDFIEAARLISEFETAQKESSIANPYPIKTRVNPSIFDVEIAQQQFWNRTFEQTNLLTSKILFYYSPYRVFDISEALGIISEGVLNSKINANNLEETHSVLIRGATISNINVNIAEALSQINKNNLRQAIKLLNGLTEKNPSHAILHYDTGLIYAQMGDFSQAHKHFLKAYHLDMTDLRAGVFAIITGNLIYKDISMLKANIAQSIADSKIPQNELELYIKLRDWSNDPKKVGVYIPDPNETRPLFFAFQSISAMRLRDIKNILTGFEQLKKKQPDDVVSNLLYDLARNYGTNIKNSALNMQYIFREKNINLDNVFYGPNLARELYIYVGFITGNLEKQKELLNYKLSTQSKNPNGLLQALGLLNIYLHNFEESYTIYDRLINTLKEDDSITRYMGAVAAIGAGQKNAASLLLQLSKMDSNINHETRYALGLLYQEAQNYNAAAQHYNTISNHGFENYGFESEFLDFTIDDEKINSPE
ncbi:tetratricopeptide repeat protein [Helicobacter muridarum]|uniref:TPR repeat-containing protein n=1 Tax=Helicobacter muridarum TaxID=216 RepID=A0A377PU06_9HELI|nr:tetratricopeptide repeat protein [Helicobacter muridarum]TLD99555.1 tetratricopeptide repeat protein [Helicobacter muridarum]STQ85892.1 TPR repeat-containing protein [Helicobacter muridarum]